MTRRKDRDVPVTAPEHATDAAGRVQVWNPQTEQITWVSPAEAAAGMIAYGKAEFGEGTPAFAVIVQKAVALLAEHGFTPGGKKI